MILLNPLVGLQNMYSVRVLSNMYAGITGGQRDYLKR